MSDDSIVIFPLCPHCLKHDVAFYLRYYQRGQGKCWICFLICGHCSHGICAEIDESPEYKRNIDHNKFTRVFPEPQSMDAPPCTPQAVAEDFHEAKFNMLHGNIKSACIMAGSAVETACVQFGAINGGLKEKIKTLLNAGIVTQGLADWAQEIRGVRVDAAHQAEREATLTQRDAEDAVFFAEMLFTYLYTLPAKIAERRKSTAKDA